jgi:cell division protein FtsN
MKASLGAVLAALALGGCVYEQSASREYRDERDHRAYRESREGRVVRESALPPQPGAPTPIIAPAPTRQRGAVMQAAAPEPDRVRTSDLSRLSPGTGIAGPEAEPYRPVRRTPYPSRLFVQAASFVTREEAERTRRSLAGLGRASVYTAYVDDQLRYRVRIGPLATPERSESVRAAVARRGYSDAIIVRD